MKYLLFLQSTVAKDSIEKKDMMSIAVTKDDRYVDKLLLCFENKVKES